MSSFGARLRGSSLFGRSRPLVRARVATDKEKEPEPLNPKSSEAKNPQQRGFSGLLWGRAELVWAAMGCYGPAVIPALGTDGAGCAYEGRLHVRNTGLKILGAAGFRNSGPLDPKRAPGAPKSDPRRKINIKYKVGSAGIPIWARWLRPHFSEPPHVGALDSRQ